LKAGLELPEKTLASGGAVRLCDPSLVVRAVA
jgi:hypothetical protein